MIDRFAFTAMTGAKHAMGQLATTTHNMANLQTPGFREMLSMFRAVPVDGASADSRYHQEDVNGGFVPLESVYGRVVSVIWPFKNLTYVPRVDVTK